MSEADAEAFVRRTFATRGYGVELRKIPESTARTPDYGVFAGGTRVAVLEVKHLEYTPPTAQNGWSVTSFGNGLQRATRALDNGPRRVITKIRDAAQQLCGHAGTKMLAFVNDENLLDVLDLVDAYNGFLIYGNEEGGYYKNTASRKLSDERIGNEKRLVDLYVWIDGCRDGEPQFQFSTAAGYALARKFFGAPSSEDQL